jgi:hypothetical protein
MTLLESLVLLSPVVTIAANITVLCFVIPAYKRTKNVAFLLLGCAALLGTFDTVCDHLVVMDSHLRGAPNYTIYRTLRRFTYFATCILGAAGVVMLARNATSGFRSNRLPRDEPIA